MARQQEYLNNYLEFLRSHRGTVRSDFKAYMVESERQEFTFCILNPESDIEFILPRFKKLYVRDPNNGIISVLKAREFQQSFGLTFMYLPDVSLSWRNNISATIRKAVTPDDFEIFSNVQCRGFSDSQEDYNDWYPFLRDANFRNIKNPNQNFYVGAINDKPAGVALTVKTFPVTGIYAVTTLQDFRKQGISTTIMRRAIADAVANKADKIILQVVTNSYAHGFYKNLGFKDVFEFKVFTQRQGT